MLLEYINRNWALILISVAFTFSLTITGFRDKSTEKRMYFLIAGVFLLSVIVFAEFYLADLGGYRRERTVLMAVRYSATPLIVAMILYALRNRMKWFIFIPAILLTAVNIISIPTGIVFRLDGGGALVRGPLGYLPYIVAGLYGVSLIWILYRNSNRLYTEIIPIAYLGLAFASGLIMPFVYGKSFSQTFCTTIIIALFVYYVFSIYQLRKKDPLTGVQNLQAFYDDSAVNPEEITALISMDMNGLKKINDSQGHAAGDAALVTLTECFRNALNGRQSVYRIGGDEFVVICRRMSQGEVESLAARIREKVAETEYSSSVGYSFRGTGKKSIDEMLKESDADMYADKARYYSDARRDRRRT